MIQRILLSLDAIKWHEDIRRRAELEARRVEEGAYLDMLVQRRVEGRPDLKVLGFAFAAKRANHRSQSI